MNKFEEGYDAWLNGLDSGLDNPYSELDEDSFFEWERGWWAAAEGEDTTDGRLLFSPRY